MNFTHPTKKKRLPLFSRLPPPSLQVGLLRPDPWNEFIERPISEQDVLSFKYAQTSNNRKYSDENSEALTTIMGIEPSAPVPLEMGEADKPQVQAEHGFLFQNQSPEPIPEEPVVVPTAGEPIAQPETSVPEPDQSIWNRLSSAWENIKNTASNPLPDWFANEASLVVPTDEEVKAVIGSIYGGNRTQVRISVRVLEAADVPVSDWWGTSDPYVCVALVRGVGGLSAGRLELLPTIGALKYTSTKFASLNPRWNEIVPLDKADLLSVISDAVLHISLWDKDIVKSDDPLGYGVVSLIDALQASGISPYPILPLQITGSLIGPHAGVFVKISLRMVKKVGVVSIIPIALQGFTKGWENYSIRLEVKVTANDPIASPTYVSDGLCLPESTAAAKINNTGHAIWPREIAPLTLLFASQKKSKPYLHITLKSDGSGPGSDAGQIAIRIGMLEKLNGISGMKLSGLDGSPDAKELDKCSLYCGVECELVDGDKNRT